MRRDKDGFERLRNEIVEKVTNFAKELGMISNNEEKMYYDVFVSNANIPKDTQQKDSQPEHDVKRKMSKNIFL